MTGTESTIFDCDAFDAHCAALLEGDLDGASRAAMETHAASCARCAAVLADVAAIRDEARALPALVPSRDLWSGIEARIAAPVIGLPAAAIHGRRARRPWLGVAAAAGLVIATAAITRALTPRATTARPVVAVAPAPAPAVVRETLFVMSPAMNVSLTGGTRDSRATVTAVQQKTERLYGREIDELQQLIKVRRTDVDPRTLAIIDYNLAVIEHAIAQTRDALAKDPASSFLLERLNGALDKKVDLLRTAAQLPSRT
ncbi:MAG: hypothetical protein ABJD07_00655 [Gemmatimonadaceae bacterium]